MNKKICKKCTVEKSINDFYQRSDSYYQSYCKPCWNIKGKQWYRHNLEKAKENSEQHYQVNKREVNKRSVEWAKKNPEKMKLYSKRHAQKSETKRYRAEWERNKRCTNPTYRIYQSISRGMRNGIHGSKNNKRWETLVNYTLDDLVVRLEKRFDDKMTWENYGSYWHIDHIRPVSSFSFESYKDNDFKQCWSLDNLQPLSAIENILKGNKILV